jgi:RimJ/RimL family protein N-acetyltransferase
MSLPAPPANLSTKARKIVEQYDEMRRPGVKPRSVYQNLPASERLRYELVDWSNYEVLLGLFKEDSSPFVMSHFRSKEALETYVAYLLCSGRYSGRHGGCDWLIIREDDTPIGVFHLFEVSFEIIDGHRSGCFFGYSIGEYFRRQGYAEEACRHVLALLPTVYHLYEVYADPLLGNTPSRTLLEKLGLVYQRDFKNGWGMSALYHKQLVDPIPSLTWEEIDPR